jgi:hypothetical protein
VRESPARLASLGFQWSAGFDSAPRASRRRADPAICRPPPPLAPVGEEELGGTVHQGRRGPPPRRPLARVHPELACGSRDRGDGDKLPSTSGPTVQPGSPDQRPRGWRAHSCACRAHFVPSDAGAAPPAAWTAPLALPISQQHRHAIRGAHGRGAPAAPDRSIGPGIALPHLGAGPRTRRGPGGPGQRGRQAQERRDAPTAGSMRAEVGAPSGPRQVEKPGHPRDLRSAGSWDRGRTLLGRTRPPLRPARIEFTSAASLA